MLSKSTLESASSHFFSFRSIFRSPKVIEDYEILGNAVFLRKCATVSEPILTKRPQKKHLNALLLFFAGISSELTYHQQVNPHRAGGRLDPPPIRYFVNNEKTAASSQKRRFWHTFLCILSAPFLKISAESHRRSDHQVRSSDPTSKNICDCTVTTVLKGSI